MNFNNNFCNKSHSNIAFLCSRTIKIISAAAVILMLLPFMYFTVSGSDTELLTNDTVELIREDCYYQNGNLMLPFRTFFESLGAAVDWEDNQKIASVCYESDTDKFEINVFMGEKPQTDNLWHIQEINSGITATINGYEIPQIS